MLTSVEKQTQMKKSVQADEADQKRPLARCYVCDASIIRSDDDALVCIPCGGRNSQVEEQKSLVTTLLDWLKN